MKIFISKFKWKNTINNLKWEFIKKSEQIKLSIYIKNLIINFCVITNK